MKNTSALLFGLAGAWVSLFLMEKISGAATAIKSSHSMWPVRAGRGSVRFFKSLILFVLAALNVFMAIALIDRRSARR
jgi:uncharacterized membrane protein YsdA (DUF1294 family)